MSQTAQTSSLDALVARRSAQTIRLTTVDVDSFPEWLEKADASARAYIQAANFTGKAEQVALVPGRRGVEEALVGIDATTSRWSWATIAERLPPGRYELERAEGGADAALGFGLRAYRFDRYKSQPRKPSDRQLVWPKGVDRAEVKRVLEAVSLVRDLVNTPAEDLGPKELCGAVVREGKAHRAQVKTIAGPALLKEGFPAVHAVGRGSPRAPMLVDLRWGQKRHPRLTLVGKGVCFDSGGLNLKGAAGMIRMKKDMGGAAITLGLAKLVMDARLPVRLRLLIPAVENMPGPGAYRPSDVVETRRGHTVEIGNTDAEGRVILSDALTEAAAEKPDLLIDVATLTGNARAALGTQIVAFFTDDETVSNTFAQAGNESADPVWRLPLHHAYRRQLDSKVADFRNIGSGAMGGAILAGLFLHEFVDEAPRWLHLDAYAWNDQARPGRPVGGAATGLFALWHLLRQRYARPPRRSQPRA